VINLNEYDEKVKIFGMHRIIGGNKSYKLIDVLVLDHNSSPMMNKICRDISRYYTSVFSYKDIIEIIMKGKEHKVMRQEEIFKAVMKDIIFNPCIHRMKNFHEPINDLYRTKSIIEGLMELFSLEKIRDEYNNRFKCDVREKIGEMHRIIGQILFQNEIYNTEYFVTNKEENIIYDLNQLAKNDVMHMVSKIDKMIEHYKNKIEEFDNKTIEEINKLKKFLNRYEYYLILWANEWD